MSSRTSAPIVRKLDPKWGGTITISVPTRMKVGLRGMFCYDGDNTEHCLANGVIQPSRDDQVYVNMRGAPYRGGEMIWGPGDFAVQVHDGCDCYGDNWGDLYFVAYPAN